MPIYPRTKLPLTPLPPYLSLSCCFHTMALAFLKSTSLSIITSYSRSSLHDNNNNNIHPKPPAHLSLSRHYHPKKQKHQQNKIKSITNNEYHNNNIIHKNNQHQHPPKAARSSFLVSSLPSPDLRLHDPTHPLSDSSMDIPCAPSSNIRRPLVTNDAFIGVIEMNCTDTLLPPNLKSHNAPVEWVGENRKMRQFFNPCALGIQPAPPHFSIDNRTGR